MKTRLIFTQHLALILIIMCALTASLMAQKQSYAYQSYAKVDIEKAKEAEVEIVQLVGELNLISRDIDYLFLGECLYDDPEHGEAKVKYNVEDKKGKLSIKSSGYQENEEEEGFEISVNDDDHTKWNLQLSDAIPLAVDIEMMAGVANINLEGTRLNSFNFSVKAGEAKVILRNTSVPKITCKAIASDATFDLRGKWKNDLDAYFKGGVGNLNLMLPAGYNIEVEVSGILGDVEANGLKKNGNTYYLKADEDSPTLHIDVTGGIGSVFLAVK